MPDVRSTGSDSEGRSKKNHEIDRLKVEYISKFDIFNAKTSTHKFTFEKLEQRTKIENDSMF